MSNLNGNGYKYKEMHVYVYLIYLYDNKSFTAYKSSETIEKSIKIKKKNCIKSKKYAFFFF